MSLDFFRQRDRYDFSNDTLDIGNPLKWDKESALKHFFLRIYAIDSSRWQEFYDRHLTYYLGKYPDGTEEIFYKYLSKLIDTRLTTLAVKDIYESKNHVRDQKEVKHLETLKHFLTPIDKWNTHETDKEIILRLQHENHILKNKNDVLTGKIKLLKALEPTEHIDIHKDGFLTLLDIFLQLQKLKLEDKEELVFAQYQATWKKIICKHFTENNKEIQYGRLTRYFPPDPEDASHSKYAPIPSKNKLFKIIPVKRGAN